MIFSSRLRYALKAVIYLSKQKEAVSANQIAREEHIPLAFLEKILQQLTRKRILKVKRGRRGGYALLRKPTLAEITFALQEEPVLPCEKNPCPFQKNCESKPIWSQAKKAIIEAFEKIKIT